MTNLLVLTTASLAMYQYGKEKCAVDHPWFVVDSSLFYELLIVDFFSEVQQLL